jgi:glycosyltransferase involved in cell wall biosynthesis
MKIHVTGLRGIPGVMGGIESHCQELLPRIKAQHPDLDIAVLCRAPYVDGGRRDYRNIRLVPLPSPRQRSLEAIVATFIAILYAFVSRAQAIHIHAIGPSLLAPLARILGLKVVVTHHGADYERAKWGMFAKLVLRLGERSSLIWAHKVIAVSPSIARDLKRLFPSQAHKVVYIPNGAPRWPSGTERADVVLHRLGVECGNFILAVGRLVPEKGLHDLIEAFEASACGSGRKLLIAGGADHESPYAHMLMQRASDDIVFAGVQPHDVLKALYDHCALFVLPSYHEGLPIAVLEAASCSAPIALSDIPANRDIGLGDAHYFPAGDVGRLAQILAGPFGTLVGDTEVVRHRFDWDRSAMSTASIYRGCAPPAAAPLRDDPIGSGIID